MVFLNFYDIVSETCQFDEQFAKRIGFKKIFVINKDVRAVGNNTKSDDDLDRCIAFGMDKNQLLSLVKRGAPAVSITDFYIDRKLMEAIKENKAILLIPMSAITSLYGIERSRTIYKVYLVQHHYENFVVFLYP